MSDTVTLQSSPVGGHHPGDVIAGKYRLEREIGRGAMGTVWAALHTTLGQRVAIKLISAEHAGSVDARHRFSLEAKAAARLRSRHVVQVYDDGETPDGTPYIVMEFLEGETLEERLARQRDMGLPEAVRITSHVGRALARAHAQGIVHRDLKSGNIFIAKTDDDELGWVAKVLDFGVAKLTDSQAPSTTKTGAIVGTPLFMSPEQIRGASQVDHRADLYSLGMVFYNMVTGSHAYDGPSYSDVLVSICTEPLPDLRLTAPWLPKGLGNWFDKACARERELRFQSADEMVDALQEAAGGVRPSALPEEVSGPSGTLMGHVPPHAAATLQVDAFPVSSPASRRAAFAEKGTLRSRHSEPPQTRSTARPARNAHGDLLWWLRPVPGSPSW
jgi:serine/threonine protein kinase